MTEALATGVTVSAPTTVPEMAAGGGITARITFRDAMVVSAARSTLLLV